MPSNKISRIKIIGAVSILFLILAGIFLGLSSWLGYLGAFISTLVIFLLLIRYLSCTILFPGSNSIWSRSLQSTFCSQLCFQGIRKISSVKDFLSSLGESEVCMNHATLKSASNFIKQVLLIYSRIPLSPSQADLESLLKSLKESLQLLKVQDRNKKCVNIWTVIEHPEKVRKTHRLDKIGDVDPSIRQCSKIIELLHRDLQISLKKILFGGDLLIGDLIYQREDFFSRFKAENISVPGEDGVEFDAAFLIPDGNKNEKTAVVYCCPNGGYFEYIYYQTDWLEFYLQQNIPIFLWNYRGYGKSKGKPSMKNLSNDGKRLVQYARDVKGFQKIILHGESLGGAIATNIAACTNVNLLIADRTFSNVFDVFASYAGAFIAFVAVVVGPQNVDCKKNFLEFDSPKILTCDINDEVIPQQASLKYSLVEGFRSNFTKSAFEKFERAIRRLEQMKKKYVKVQVRTNKNLFQDNANYISLNSEELDLTIENFFNGFIAIAEKLDSAGHGLLETIDNPKTSQAWLKALEVWGSSPITYGAEFYDLRSAAVERLRNFIQGSSRLVHDCEQSGNAELRKMASILTDIEQVLSEALSHLENRSMFDKRNGMLIILKCGHCGSFDTVEKYVLEKLITKNLIIE